MECYKSIFVKKKTNVENYLQKTTKVLLNNRLDKKFQRIFQPVHFLQGISLCPKYNILDNYITPKGLISNGFTIFGTFVFLGICVFRLCSNFLAGNIHWHMSILYVSQLFDTFFVVFGYIVNSIIIMSRSESNVFFILKIHKVYKFLKVNYSFKSNIMDYWCYVIAIYLYFFLVHIHYYFVSQFPFVVQDMIFDVLVINFDVNLIQAICAIKLIRKYVEIWTDKVIKCEDDENAANDEEYARNVFETYMDIIDACKIFKYTFQEMVTAIFLGAYNRYYFSLAYVVTACK